MWGQLNEFVRLCFPKVVLHAWPILLPAYRNILYNYPLYNYYLYNSDLIFSLPEGARHEKI